MKAIHTDEAPAAIGPYSQAVSTAPGELVFCSGQIPLDPVTGALVGDDAAAQAEQVMTNLSAVLRASGCDAGDVVKTTIYLVDMADFGAVNAVYARHMGDHRPARATVAVAGLPKAVQVEIDCVAVRKRS